MPDGTTNTITYSLDNSAGGRFAINSSTGVVTVADGTLLNFEAATSHSIIIRATSADGSFTTENFTINLTDVDEFDVTPVTDSNPAANSLAENSANGSLVGITASASDADGTTNTITYSLDNSAGGRFAINASTGVVSVADGSLLNFEAATSHSITHPATSADGSFTTENFTINLTDVDEFDVTRRSRIVTQPPTALPKTRPTVAWSGSPPPPATSTARPTRSPTRWTTTPADASRSTPAPAWSA